MEQRKADLLYHLKACEMDQRAMDLSAAEQETRKAINHAMKDYNLALVGTQYSSIVVHVHVCSTLLYHRIFIGELINGGYNNTLYNYYLLYTTAHCIIHVGFTKLM